jgi:hypothetical protein
MIQLSILTLISLCKGHPYRLRNYLAGLRKLLTTSGVPKDVVDECVAPGTDYMIHCQQMGYGMQPMLLGETRVTSRAGRYSSSILTDFDPYDLEHARVTNVEYVDSLTPSVSTIFEQNLHTRPLHTKHPYFQSELQEVVDQIDEKPEPPPSPVSATATAPPCT